VLGVTRVAFVDIGTRIAVKPKCALAGKLASTVVDAHLVIAAVQVFAFGV
jgi:hypothetical protein